MDRVKILVINTLINSLLFSFIFRFNYSDTSNTGWYIGNLAGSFVFYLAIVLIANIFIFLLSYIFDKIIAQTKLNAYIGIRLLLKLSFYILSITFFQSFQPILILTTIVVVIHILLEFLFLEDHTFKISSKRFTSIFQYSLISLAGLFIAANLIIGFSY